MKRPTFAAAFALSLCGLFDPAAAACRATCNACDTTDVIPPNGNISITLHASDFDSRCYDGKIAKIAEVDVMNTGDQQMKVLSLSSSYRADKPLGTIDCYHTFELSTSDPTQQRVVEYVLGCASSDVACSFQTMPWYQCYWRPQSTTCCYDDHGVFKVSNEFIQCTDPSEGNEAKLSVENGKVVATLRSGIVIPYCTKTPTPAPTPTPTTTIRSASAAIATPIVLLSAMITISTIVNMTFM
ncbi:hypothetical protein PINS_up003191 [Pythium insidiosum]|nr:hypothetical protein PINS_up003191 [Pythium insidiosum]